MSFEEIAKNDKDFSDVNVKISSGTPNDVTTSRALDTQYTNNNDYTIFVLAHVKITALPDGWATAMPYLDGAKLGEFNMAPEPNISDSIVVRYIVTIPVGPGLTYEIKSATDTAGNSVSLTDWNEVKLGSQ